MDKLIKFKDFIVKNKVHVIYIALILLIVLVAYLVLNHNKVVSKEEFPAVITITDTTPASVAAGQEAVGKYTGKNDAADVSKLIDKAVQQQPTAVYITTTQAAADKQAQTMAKADKADYVLKQPTNTDQQISNNYYAISQERKHRIAVGATAVNGQAYATVAYTNDRLTYEIHSKDLKGIDGGSVLYTVKKW